MKDEYIREGETFEVTLTDTDMDAQTATITVSDEDGAIIKQETSSYSTVDGKRVATLSFEADFPIGVYFYMYTVNYTAPRNRKFPNTDKCKDDGECELPKFIVCDANDVEPES